MRSKRTVGGADRGDDRPDTAGLSSTGAPRRCESDTLAGMATVDLADQSWGGACRAYLSLGTRFVFAVALSWRSRLPRSCPLLTGLGSWMAGFDVPKVFSPGGRLSSTYRE